MSPELTRALRHLHLSRRDFANIVGVHEDVVYAWDRKRSSSPDQEFRPQPLWVNHLINAWLENPSLLGTALATALAASRKKLDNPDDNGISK